MKSKMKMRYYCDHCRKSGGSRHHMERHERGCTNNPNRVCGVCGQHGVADGVKSLLAGLDDTKLFEDRLYREKALSDLREEAEYCPACMLAALRQNKGGLYLEFDYKAEHDSYWKERNSERELY